MTPITQKKNVIESLNESILKYMQVFVSYKTAGTTGDGSDRMSKEYFVNLLQIMDSLLLVLYSKFKSCKSYDYDSLNNELQTLRESVNECYVWIPRYKEYQPIESEIMKLNRDIGSLFIKIQKVLEEARLL